MKSLIKQLCEAYGAGGHSDIAQVIVKRMGGLADDIYTDSLGNVVAIRRCGRKDASLLMLEAHMDEIGFLVTHVDDDGFVHVSNCGGIDKRVLSAAEVLVLADEPLCGVFCSTPPHLSDGENTVKPLEDMGIDVGLPADDVKRLIPVGTRVVFRSHFDQLGEYAVCSKALDNRAGCAAVIGAMEMLKDKELALDVAAVFSVQEEIGGAGAAVASFSVKPSAAVVTDVSFASTPDAPPHKCGKLSKGAMLGVAPGLDRMLTRRLEDIAAAHDLPLQYEAVGGDTGTDADGIASTREGIPTGLLSIPQRYMHTPVEVVDVRDVQTVASLMAYAAIEGVV